MSRSAPSSSVPRTPPGEPSRRRAPYGPIDPDALMRLKGLELRARAVVEGFLTGLHRSPYHGFSVEFSDYRPYMEGDDLRYPYRCIKSTFMSMAEEP